jgi:pimeloyl-ACP methyl ester carboxylesterase
MLVEKAFDSGKVVLNYLEGPKNGPPLVFLHGGASTSLNWEKVMESLFQEYHVIAPDFRGYGKSGRAKGAYKIKDFAYDIVALIEKEIGKPTCVIGHSLGSIVALQVAVDTPDYVKSIVLEDPPLYLDLSKWLFWPGVEMMFDLGKDMIESGCTEEDLYQRLIEMPGDNAKVFARSRAYSLSHFDFEYFENIRDGSWREGFDTDETLDKVSCPVLLLHGEEKLGSVLTAEEIEKAQSVLRNVIVEGFEEVGHNLHAQRLEKFTKLVRKFLESH